MVLLVSSRLSETRSLQKSRQEVLGQWGSLVPVAGAQEVVRVHPLRTEGTWGSALSMHVCLGEPRKAGGPEQGHEGLLSFRSCVLPSFS